MKTKLFLAAMAVTFSLAMISCGGNKAANATDGVDSTAVEAACPAEAATCCKADSAACDSAKTCTKEQKESCCKEKKAACDKK